MLALSSLSSLFDSTSASRGSSVDVGSSAFSSLSSTFFFLFLLRSLNASARALLLLRRGGCREASVLLPCCFRESPPHFSGSAGVGEALVVALLLRCCSSLFKQQARCDLQADRCRGLCCCTRDFRGQRRRPVGDRRPRLRSQPPGTPYGDDRRVQGPGPGREKSKGERRRKFLFALIGRRPSFVSLTTKNISHLSKHSSPGRGQVARRHHRQHVLHDARE